ncbi:lipid-A-disaccharide synthase [Burkholderiaceae bacterium FT117]|uniref:lipid-A-disaccharide synthase n=1 Tax=Zeimonas sediminis TaxID=2944268 RepID=UPI002342E218|nr:lipid-A-disaccharide synthase [Zeimonas sediminis]MCM5569197.1 lipid-A-disaccharide synthase [Zeimonas sediminis]
MAGLSVGMVAGEASGDLLAAAVLDGLAARAGTLQARGIGGPRMQERGFDAWWTIDALSVNGYIEVLREYPRLKRMRDSLRERLIDWRPDVFVGVDAPDFNLDLEAALRGRGIRTVHFIGPSIWAWRGERIEKIRRAADHVLLVFPFEEEIYREAGIPATYVGHPLADRIPEHTDAEAARRALGLFPGGGPVVALLPGSRRGEVERLGPDFLRTAAWLHVRRPDIRFLLPAANDRLFERLREMISLLKLPPTLPLTLVSGRSHEVIAAADTVLVASGTATLEVALMRKPMVIAYRLAWLSYRIMRRMAYLPWIGLPNILCRDFVVPEFVQGAVKPDALGAALLRQLDDDAARASIAGRFADLHGQLRRDCASRAAERILELGRG